MIDKNMFVNLMTRWASLNDDIDAAENALSKIFTIGDNVAHYKFDELVCDAIAAGVGDEADWVSYFAFERGFDLSEECVWDANHNVTPTRTWGEVYDLIVEDHSDD